MKKFLFIFALFSVAYLNCTRTCYVLAVPEGTTSSNYTGSYSRLPETYEKSWRAGDCNHNDAGAQQIAKNNSMIAVDACWIHSASCPEAGAILNALQNIGYAAAYL